MAKTYIGFSRDHSGSMYALKQAAMRDYNQNIATIKEEAIKNNQDTIVSTVTCGIYDGGHHNGVIREVVNSNVHTLKPLTSYLTHGQTPLFDSIGELIEIMENVPDANDPSVAFLILVITDGAENASDKWRTKLKDKLAELQKTDRWTFVFRVPRGYTKTLTALGIPAGNIMEWDQTEASLDKSSADTVAALSGFYDSRAKGKTATRSFYTDLSTVTKQEVESKLWNITPEVVFYNVENRDHDKEISTFVQEKRGPMIKGCAFYQLTKPEKEIQDYKKLAIRNRITGQVFAGPAARQLLGFPHYGSIKVIPGSHGEWDIFVQSTSLNRKIKSGTRLLYWSRAV
jgi:hypothetical protein